MAEQEEQTKEEPPKPYIVEIKGRLGVTGPYERIPIHLSLNQELQKGILALLKHLGEGGVETKVFLCKGATNTLEEVTVVASVRGDGDYSRLGCPRLQTELMYLRDGFGRLEHFGRFCYGGDLKSPVPVVKEAEFAANNIFPCPYARLPR